MNRRKHPRKYSITKYAGKWGDYYVGKAFRVPIALAFVYFACLGCFMTLGSALAFLYALYCLLCGGDPNPRETAGAGVAFFVFLLASLTGDYILYRVVRAFIKLPQGHLLNPLPPEPNGILPESQILVRASAPADSATLLRAASGKETDDAPAVLLRAVNSEIVE